MIRLQNSLAVFRFYASVHRYEYRTTVIMHLTSSVKQELDIQVFYQSSLLLFHTDSTSVFELQTIRYSVSEILAVIV